MDLQSKYTIGKKPCNCDLRESYDISDPEWQHLISSLKEGDSVIFDGIYAVVSEAAHAASPPYLIFQVTPNGQTKKIERERHDWGQYWWNFSRFGLLKEHIRSSGTDAVQYCPTLLDINDAEILTDREMTYRRRRKAWFNEIRGPVQYQMQAITAMPVYTNKSFEEL